MRNEIRLLPRYSSIIFYFAGHGIRNVSPGGDYDEDVHLLLSGQPLTNYHSGSLLFAELIDALERKKMVTGIVVIDSCHSGSPMDSLTRTGQLVRMGSSAESFRLPSPRFVYYFATASDQQAFSGEFTKDFITAWKTTKGEDECVRPENIMHEMQKITHTNRPDDIGHRNRTMIPFVMPSWCLSNAGQPSTILIIVPKAGFHRSIDVTFSDGFYGTLNFEAQEVPLFLRIEGASN